MLKELEEAAVAATQGYAAFGEYLKSLLPRTSSPDAIGRERYQILSRRFLGATVDLDETYEWGKEELARVTAEQEAVAREIKPGATVLEAIDFLDNDPSRKLIRQVLNAVAEYERSALVAKLQARAAQAAARLIQSQRGSMGEG